MDKSEWEEPGRQTQEVTPPQGRWVSGGGGFRKVLSCAVKYGSQMWLLTRKSN